MMPLNTDKIPCYKDSMWCENYATLEVFWICSSYYSLSSVIDWVGGLAQVVEHLPSKPWVGAPVTHTHTHTTHTHTHTHTRLILFVNIMCAHCFLPPWTMQTERLRSWCNRRTWGWVLYFPQFLFYVLHTIRIIWVYTMQYKFGCRMSESDCGWEQEGG
jgi:hypothetical protein